MGRELRIGPYKNPLFIKLRFIKNLKKNYGYRGSAIWDDDNHRPREFVIECDDSLSKKMSTLVLLHEMTHVKQYAKGQLKDLMRSFRLKRWGNKLVDECKTKYSKRPWEVEAYKFEKEYYEKWKVYNKKKCQ
jgi:hypothetical protein